MGWGLGILGEFYIIVVIPALILLPIVLTRTGGSKC